MKTWIRTLDELEQQGKAYVLITLLGVKGSTPRDTGTKMVVTLDDAYHSIGGGHLEFKAIAQARDMLEDQDPAQNQHIEHYPLGAKLGQCCGGSTSLLFERFVTCDLNILLVGAGHVGKSLITILNMLPAQIHWFDNREQEFPLTTAPNVTRLIDESPEQAINQMPAGSYYIIMSHKHSLDFDITELILKRDDAAYIGLIGSQTKWARFKQRFAHKQYPADFYAPVNCPVGHADIPGKLPMEVAVSIAAEIIKTYHQADKKLKQSGISWSQLKQNLELKPI